MFMVGKDGFVPYSTAKEHLGISIQTLRKWADQGHVPSIRTPGGKRLYGIQKLINKDQESTKQSICYCRVSSQGQKDDLKRQIEFMSKKFPGHRIVSDIGSGINFKRKGFLSILNLASQGMVDQVVVAYRDRLCRFAFELVEWILQRHGVKLLVLNQKVESSEQSELAEDLLSIINVFNCRVNGKRKYGRGKTEGSKEQEDRETDSESKQEIQTQGK
jgi:putative resolvase